MNKSHLVACSRCARHVRASEASCPFCRTELPQALRASLPRRPPPPRLSRAALFALGTGAATIATACGGSVDSGGTTQQADGGSHDGGVAQPAYGGGVHDFDSGADTGSAALYGGIFPGDAGGVSQDASTPEDASEPADASLPDTGAAPPYGQPPTPPPPPPDEP